MTVPTSTYRLQLHSGFTLHDAVGLIDYLTALGVGGIYLSPVLTSTTGSEHGYDVTDPTTIDPQRGGEEGFTRLLEAARRAGLPVVVDIVPNHLGVDVPEENPAWWDVLTNGRDSAYAAWFDIDWSRQKIILPVLGDGADELENLRLDDGRLAYWEHRFPIAPGTGDGTPQQVHDRQHYQLVNFRRAQTDLGYRRFFAVSSLAGVRVEDPDVFDATHERIATMISQGVSGLRVDHPDGLADPVGYLRRLRSLAPDAWITVEKILEPGEELPPWPVAGTTGYDALLDFTGVLVDTAAEQELTSIYRRRTGDDHDAADHIRIGKQFVLDTLFGSELRRIARLAPTLPGVTEVIKPAAVAYRVYRSYLPDDAALQQVLDQVRDKRPDLAPTVDALRHRLADPTDELAVRFQQLTGAVMAKGVEDTAFYRYHRLTALNEVGGDPGRFGTGVDDFHTAQQRRLERWPQSMTTLSTHDTKRSEDVRAALAVLAEVPRQWADFSTALSAAAPMPEPGCGYLLAQTLAAVGLIDPARLKAYLIKAVREAAVGTAWIDGDAKFEAAVEAGIDRIYGRPEIAALVTGFREVVRAPALVNAYGQKLLQLTAPGVPDVYQGTELLDDSLVDPDNRRPVDFGRRAGLLADLDAGRLPSPDDPDAVKLLITSQALRARREATAAGGLSGYRALRATGPAAQHLIGFDRGGLIAVATRLPVGLAAAGGWGPTEIELPEPGRPHTGWTDRLTGARYAGGVPVRRLLDRFPVALLQAAG
ncbi:malto-oligosyltrehalose synthase [Microlunatus sp. Gsoil 973]|uniref:malto-oligosyltrehalose synthase n=1 Tax=Microlunatus sp. Gsoil 973 TaxID=2672569 RepID=UPI0012B45B84|nr:malto-oligosyltrehalose synthase [Microlunatus sp. Gsoil 973]QGN35042.1 malto-oligosyltrehalose synthase [Microlunatus sp. Gsoil 973]